LKARSSRNIALRFIISLLIQYQFRIYSSMYTKSWQILKDDNKKTFEVCGQEMNTNGFTNRVLGMQRVGMNVSYVTPPVTNKNSSKSTIQVLGYTKEDGLQERLANEYREIMMRSVDMDIDPDDDGD